MNILKKIFHNVMNLIRDQLNPTILTPKYREENKNNPMFGHLLSFNSSIILSYEYKQF